MLVKGYLHRKARVGDAIGNGSWNGGRPFEKSTHLSAESPVKKAFLSTMQADPPGSAGKDAGRNLDHGSHLHDQTRDPDSFFRPSQPTSGENAAINARTLLPSGRAKGATL